MSSYFLNYIIKKEQSIDRNSKVPESLLLHLYVALLFPSISQVLILAAGKNKAQI